MIVPFCNPTSKAISQAFAIVSCFLIKSSQPFFLSLSYFFKVVRERERSASHPSPLSGLSHLFPSSHSTCLTPQISFQQHDVHRHRGPSPTRVTNHPCVLETEGFPGMGAFQSVLGKPACFHLHPVSLCHTLMELLTTVAAAVKLPFLCLFS